MKEVLLRRKEENNSKADLKVKEKGMKDKEDLINFIFDHAKWVSNDTLKGVLENVDASITDT